MPRDDAEHDALLAKHGFPTDAVPRGIRADMSDPGFSFVNRDGIKLRNWICVLDGVIIDGHQGSDLWPGDGCIMCNRDWEEIYDDG